MALPSFIQSASDLVTPYEDIRAGFLRIALEKNRQATPFVKEAKALKTIASTATDPAELTRMEDIRPALLSAAGFSDKAIKHLTYEDQQQAITNLAEQFLEPAGSDFVDELVFRYLLTRGDTLGGRMRNLAGQLAEQQLIRTLIATLSIRGKQFQWLDSDTKTWVTGNKNDPNTDLRARGLGWETEGKARTLLLNLKLPGIGKNVDLCLFDVRQTDISRVRNKGSAHLDLNRYLALGELKGGIDPAGADEHWKTANSALSRVRNTFDQEGLSPGLFFIGAAIANSMAEEIFLQLHNGQLSFAANLTSDEQLVDVCNWLIGL